MKKLILTIITLSIITITGCYDPDTATVRINLGNIPITKHAPVSFFDRVLGFFEKEALAQTIPEGVTKIHVAAYSGTSLLATASINAEDVKFHYTNGEVGYDYVELEVPAGDNITILVVGQSNRYDFNDTLIPYAMYFGYTTQSISAGETADIMVYAYTTTSLQLDDSTWVDKIYFTFQTQETGTLISWNDPGIPAKFKVIGNYESIYTAYEGNGTSFTVDVIPSCTYYYFHLVFEPFGIETDDSIYFTSSCGK